MHKLTLIILLTIGTMAFGQPNKGKLQHSEKNTKVKTPNHVKGATESKGSKSKDHHSGNSPVFDKSQKGNNSNKGDKSHKMNQKDFGKQVDKMHGYQGNNKKMHYEKGHPNFNYVFVNTHGYYSHKNYGQWRSEQAKNKHKHYHPLYEYQAIEGFNLIKTRNIFLYSETEYKINLLNKRLTKKRKENNINIVQYDWYMRRIAVLQLRRTVLINTVL